LLFVDRERLLFKIPDYTGELVVITQTGRGVARSKTVGWT